MLTRYGRLSICFIIRFNINQGCNRLWHIEAYCNAARSVTMASKEEQPRETSQAMLSVVIPARDEEECLGPCLASILAQDAAFPVQVVVSVNGAMDRTAFVAIAYAGAFCERGMTLTIVITRKPGKSHALNLAERFCTYQNRLYLDADTTISPGLLSALAEVLARAEPIYVCASMRAVAQPDPFSRAYAKVWTRLPAISEGAHGIGLYAVNASGRRRWQRFPPIHSEDKFVRLLFAESERHKLAGESYTFPIAGGFADLVSLRTRWSRGNIELRKTYPAMRDDRTLRLKSYIAFLGCMPRMPIASLLCLAVFAIAALKAMAGQRRAARAWRRGRRRTGPAPVRSQCRGRGDTS